MALAAPTRYDLSRAFNGKSLTRSNLKWAGHMGRKGDGKLEKRSDAQKVEGNGGEEDRECNGRTALREIWKEWGNGEQQLHIGVLIENVAREK